MILLSFASEAPRVGAIPGFPPWGTLPRPSIRGRHPHCGTPQAHHMRARVTTYALATCNLTVGQTAHPHDAGELRRNAGVRRVCVRGT